MASMLRMFSSKTFLQHLDSTIDPFQEVVICSDCAASQFKLDLLLASITAGKNGVHDLFAASHFNLSCLVLWMVLEEQLKGLCPTE